MKFSRLLVLFSLICLMAVAQAQNGTLRGTVTNGETGEKLLGATIRLIQGDAIKGGAYTDLEGSYSAVAAPGTYTAIISYVSFVSDTIPDIVLTSGEVTVQNTLLFISMETREDLQVNIVAKRDQTSTVSLYTTKRKSINTIDGVSVDLIKRTGDANVAAAMQRITGVTVEGGKYVYVRGLGDRYSKTTLNGAELPGLDPNRNTVQMDIFPSNLIDNILVYKNFTPDLPGSFTGGLVDVITKDFPDRFKINVSASAGYNNQANLRDDFLTYQTGSQDWLGRDDGTRALPDLLADPAFEIPTRNGRNAEAANAIDQASKAFKTDMFPTFGNSSLNQNYQISLGDQLELGNRPFGYIASLSYRTNFSAYDDGYIGRFKNTDSTATQLNTEREHDVQSATEEVLWGGLIKLSYKPHPNHKVSVNFMHNQSGESYTRTFEGPIPFDQIGTIFQTRVLGYTQRQLQVYQTNGSHVFGKLQADWLVSYAESRQDEPDLRFFSNDYEQINPETRIYDIQPNLYSQPSRFFRDLEEENLNAKLDLELPFQQWSDLDSKLRFGGAFTDKNRIFNEVRYQLSQGVSTQSYNGDPAAFFDESNLGVRFVDTTWNGQFDDQGQPVFAPDYKYGNFLELGSLPENSYVGSQTVLAFYGMVELPLTDRLKFVGGARMESTEAEVISGNSDIDPGVLSLNDILPSANLIFAVKNNMNLRGGYSRTLARPSFREFAPYSSFDFVGDYLLTGNPDLKRTLIDNYDLRWEWFPSPRETITISGFYKGFTDPIEKVLEARAANIEFTFANVAEATVYGVEFEFRKNMGFLMSGLKNLELSGNVALIKSEVSIDPLELSVIRSVDPDRPATRPMFGQSPYSVNGEALYISDSLGLTISLSYTVFGERIAVVGGKSAPDVYEQPRGLMNLSISKNLGRFGIRFRANNLLDPEYKQTQSYKGQEYMFQNYSLGRSFSLGLSYKI